MGWYEDSKGRRQEIMGPPGFWSGYQDGYEKGRGETAHRYWKYVGWFTAAGLAGGLVLGWVLHGGLR